MIEIEPPKQNGEQEIGKQDKLLTTKFHFEIEHRKVVFKFMVNSQGVNIEFTLYELKCTIHATPSGPKYLQQIFWFFLCDPRRTHRFCTRVGLAISEYHPIDEYKLQIAFGSVLLNPNLSR